MTSTAVYVLAGAIFALALALITLSLALIYRTETNAERRHRKEAERLKQRIEQAIANGDTFLWPPT